MADLVVLSREAVDSPRAVRSMSGPSPYVLLQLRERCGESGTVNGEPRLPRACAENSSVPWQSLASTHRRASSSGDLHCEKEGKQYAQGKL